MIARRTTALALTNVANSTSVLRIQMELILLAIAYLATETYMENLFDFTATLDKLKMPCDPENLVIDYLIFAEEVATTISLSFQHPVSQ